MDSRSSRFYESNITHIIRIYLRFTLIRPPDYLITHNMKVTGSMSILSNYLVLTVLNSYVESSLFLFPFTFRISLYSLTKLKLFL